VWLQIIVKYASAVHVLEGTEKLLHYYLRLVLAERPDAFIADIRS
jgi:hypothetical protein